MPLPFPNLDDRSFDQLVKQACDQIANKLNSDWTDLSPGDPGVVLLEAFAYLTEQMIYRLNRLPRKVYIAFLRMLGVTINPPTAARVLLKVWHSSPVMDAVFLPRGCRVSISEKGSLETGERLVFTTIEDAEIPPDSTSIDWAVSVPAYHCEQVEESLGKSDGSIGQIFQVRQPPIASHLPNEASWLELALGVEVIDPADRAKDDWIGSDGKFYHLWTEVMNFSEGSPSGEDFMVDRQAGLIRFAPAARQAANELVRPLAAVPASGHEIRIWYPRGGGTTGNLNAGQLKTLLSVPGLDKPPAVELTNPEPAYGGFDAETLENALIRGPQEIFSQSRAVTAREFENIVLGTRQVARARAFAQASLWRHAAPGTVDIVMVPGQRNEVNLRLIEDELRGRSPIGIRSQLRWVRYKQVWVDATITVRGKEEPAAIQQRVTDRLNQLLSPLPTPEQAQNSDASDGSVYSGGWPFGQQLRVADIYSQILLHEGPSILINSLDLHLRFAPSDNITCLAADFHQPHTWYAGSGWRLFRSTNDGAGWELVLDLEPDSDSQVLHRVEQAWIPENSSRDETLRHVCPSPDRPGLVAASAEARVEGVLQSSLYLSLDCGESWYHLAVRQDFGSELHPGTIEDMAWLVRRDRPVLLLATEGGLLEADLEFGTDGRLQDRKFYQVPVVDKQPAFPIYALAVVRTPRGSNLVVAALKGRGGVYFSTGDDLGSGKPFEPLLLGEDIRNLKVQNWKDRIYLWGATMALNDNGQGCCRWQFDLSRHQFGPGNWVSQRWFGGSCLAVTFDQDLVYAATAWGGLLRATMDERQLDQTPAWERFPSPDLPKRPIQLEGTSRKEALIEPLIVVDARDGVLMVASQSGIFRRQERKSLFESERYEKIARDTLIDLEAAVTLPPDWLLMAGPHQIEAKRDHSSLKEDAAPQTPAGSATSQEAA